MRSATRAVALGAVLLLAACGSPDVTRARLERALAPTFANLYVQRAALLGETTVTVQSVAPKAVCDRGGPRVADLGPGADWICRVTFTDDQGRTQTGTFDLQVKANSTYVADGPTRLVGPAMITDVNGQDVPNPVFEFDGAFDPNS